MNPRAVPVCMIFQMFEILTVHWVTNIGRSCKWMPEQVLFANTDGVETIDCYSILVWRMFLPSHFPILDASPLLFGFPPLAWTTLWVFWSRLAFPCSAFGAGLILLLYLWWCCSLFFVLCFSVRWSRAAYHLRTRLARDFLKCYSARAFAAFGF